MEANMSDNYPTFTPEELQNEIWKPVPEYEGLYSVSDLGRVRRETTVGWYHAGRLLKPNMNIRYAHLQLFRNGKGKRLYLHRIVCAAFLGPCPVEKEVNHISGDRFDNRILNLEYVTPSENMSHAFRLGLNKSPMLTHPERIARGSRHGSQTKPESVVKGEKQKAAKLKDSDIPEIRRMLASGLRKKDIAQHFGIAKQTLHRIQTGKGWKHVI
jgi:predicted DNA-binding protein (UPF0251 family)